MERKRAMSVAVTALAVLAALIGYIVWRFLPDEVEKADVLIGEFF